jgi:hypothetical protein
MTKRGGKHVLSDHALTEQYLAKLCRAPRAHPVERRFQHVLADEPFGTQNFAQAWHWQIGLDPLDQTLGQMHTMAASRATFNQFERSAASAPVQRAQNIT